MAEISISAARAESSRNGDFIIRRLPPWMPKDPESGNFLLLEAVGRAIDRLEDDINDVEDATQVQNADTIPQLHGLGQMVDLPPREDEDVDRYRTRVMNEFQLATNEGTIADLLENIATLLEIDVSNLEYRKQTENGSFLITIPKRSLNDLDLTTQEFVDIIDSQVAAGFRIDTGVSGTLTFLAESAYSGPYDSANGGYDPSQLDSDATLGYDGLDSNGDPKNNGGTYAGLLN